MPEPKTSAELDVLDLVTVSAGARIRSVPENTLRLWMRRGRFKVVRIGNRSFLSRKELEQVRDQKKA